MAGFSLAQADVLRKAVGKKIKKLLDEQEEGFKKGCKNNNIPNDVANKFWSLVEPFNRYGFNKSHAVCYAMISYQTAYLKANYPIQFMIAELNSSKDIERIKEVISELKDMNIKVLPPSIDSSESTFCRNGKNIRFGLSAIKGMNTKIVDNILQERNKNIFVSLEDFMTRIGKDLNKKVISLLAQSGAIDDWGNRADISEMADSIVIYSKAEVQDTLPKFIIPKIPSPTIGQRLVWEKELLGLYVSDNPARDYYSNLKTKGCTDICELANLIGKKITIGGVITDFTKKVTRNKKTIYFITLQDMSGEIEIMLFPSVYAKYTNVFEKNNVVTLFGTIQTYGDKPKFNCLVANKITSLA